MTLMCIPLPSIFRELKKLLIVLCILFPVSSLSDPLDCEVGGIELEFLVGGNECEVSQTVRVRNSVSEGLYSLLKDTVMTISVTNNEQTTVSGSMTCGDVVREYVVRTNKSCLQRCVVDVNDFSLVDGDEDDSTIIDCIANVPPDNSQGNQNRDDDLDDDLDDDENPNRGNGSNGGNRDDDDDLDDDDNSNRGRGSNDINRDDDDDDIDDDDNSNRGRGSNGGNRDDDLDDDDLDDGDVDDDSNNNGRGNDAADVIALEESGARCDENLLTMEYAILDLERCDINQSMTFQSVGGDIVLESQFQTITDMVLSVDIQEGDLLATSTLMTCYQGGNVVAEEFFVNSQDCYLENNDGDDIDDVDDGQGGDDDGIDVGDSIDSVDDGNNIDGDDQQNANSGSGGGSFGYGVLGLLIILIRFRGKFRI